MELLDQKADVWCVLLETASFPYGCPIQHSHLLGAPYPHQHWVLSVFLILVVLVGVWWYLSGVLICISLMTNDIKNLHIWKRLQFKFLSLKKKIKLQDIMNTWRTDIPKPRMFY